MYCIYASVYNMCEWKRVNETRYHSKTKSTTLSNGYLGSRNDEERSEMRYVMRIAEFSESSNL
jgi:trehalose/maltose hydrolase-like predicted phosphorylase